MKQPPGRQQKSNRENDHGKVKFGSLMGALKTGAHQLKVVNFDPNYLHNVCFF